MKNTLDFFGFLARFLLLNTYFLFGVAVFTVDFSFSSNATNFRKAAGKGTQPVSESVSESEAILELTSSGMLAPPDSLESSESESDKHCMLTATGGNAGTTTKLAINSLAL
jgi:hypothetical protein